MEPMAEQFNGKVVMVTGACGGLGRVVVKRFIAAGAILIMAERNEAKLKALQEEVGEPHLALPLDVTVPEQIDKAVAEATAKHGHIDILIHAVGGFAMGDPVHNADLGVWDKMMALNARSVFVTCGRVAKHMVENQVAGKIVVMLAKPSFQGAKNMAAYAASKAAAQRVVESMALELAEHNININGVAPSTIATAANREAMPNADQSKWVQPDQLVDAMMFLASDAARRIRGTTLEVYG